jgi:hypothetical protein
MFSIRAVPTQPVAEPDSSYSDQGGEPSWILGCSKDSNLAYAADTLSLDRALKQRRDDLALEQHEDDEGGYQDQNRARAQ